MDVLKNYLMRCSLFSRRCLHRSREFKCVYKCIYGRVIGRPNNLVLGICLASLFALLYLILQKCHVASTQKQKKCSFQPPEQSGTRPAHIMKRYEFYEYGRTEIIKRCFFDLVLFLFLICT